MKNWRSAAVAVVCLIAVSFVTPNNARAERIKDIADVIGVRENQLVGYGLVVGLNGTGDQTTQTPFTVQTVRNMLEQLGISVPVTGRAIRLRNVAAVSVHASLPPFSRQGQAVDVTVSSIGNADSLRGGSLLMTPLKGADGNVYAMAQGELVVSGIDASGRDGSRITINQPNAGRIPNGATVEREVGGPFFQSDSLLMALREGDFTTSRRVALAINRALGVGTAEAIDATAIRVHVPDYISDRVEFMSVVENLQVRPDDAPARIVVNSRTGTVVIGQHVRIMPAAITHGNLIVTISEQPGVSQPTPFGGGVTAIIPQSQMTITEEGERMFVFEGGNTLQDLVQAVNEVGAAPSDLVAILEALKKAGALQAELTII